MLSRALFIEVEEFEPEQLELDATLVMLRKKESPLTLKSATFTARCFCSHLSVLEKVSAGIFGGTAGRT